MKTVVRSQKDSGFTLVLTLSIMVLLTVIGVGYLSLSTISLRTSSHGEAMAVARSNARLALMMALGELQKSAGPDQRITARGDIFSSAGTVAKPYIVGVWQSNNTIASPPSTSDYSATTKSGEFLRWLVSTADSASATQQGYAMGAASQNEVNLWDEGSLGAADPSAYVAAEKMEITDAKNRKGALAWAVADEGMKARINTSYDQTAVTDADKMEQLGSGVRPGVEHITGLEKLKRENFEKTNSSYIETIQKGVTLSNAAFAFDQLASGVKTILKERSHDVTTYSRGLFTDVTTGGLKEDLNLFTEGGTASIPNLSSTYTANTKIYASRFKFASSNADPSWNAIYQFAKLYRNPVGNLPGVKKEGAMPVISAAAPTGWRAMNQTIGTGESLVSLNTAPPSGLVLMPVIEKVQMLFSIAVRDIYQGYPKGSFPNTPTLENQLHSPWGNNFKGTNYDYFVHLVYTPIVTLYNPYNVTLNFSGLQVEFMNVPFAIQVYRNGVAQAPGAEMYPVDQLYYAGTGRQDGSKNKSFIMNIMTKTTGGTPGAPNNVRLAPGEVKMFSPYIDPNTNWQAEKIKNGSGLFDDYNSSVSASSQAISGWRGNAIGYNLDWFDPFGDGKIESENVQGATGSKVRGGCIPVRANDELHFEYAPFSIAKAAGKFMVNMNATVNGSTTSTGAIEFNYGSQMGLRKILLGSETGKLRYPKDGTKKAYDFFEHHTVPMKDYVNTNAICIINASAKTTHGGKEDSRDGSLVYPDGRNFNMPYVHAHPVIGASVCNMNAVHPANLSHEVNIVPIYSPNGVYEQIQLDAKERSNAITGLTSINGSKRAGLYEIPLAPIQALPQLNGANLAGSTGYLPRFAQPIGNSWASPMLDSKSSRGAANEYDHCFLLNTALYDRFYFSGLASETGAFASGNTAAIAITNFQTKQTLKDTRMIFHAPDGKTDETINKELIGGVASVRPFAAAAAWQQMNGAFNINSTSVEAWKAMLSSIHADKALYNKNTSSNAITIATALSNLSFDLDKITYSRFRLPLAVQGDDDSFWLGAREITANQLTSLATQIVNQIKKRGPFLSLSEFVNRQLVSGELGAKGAIQAAIDSTDINTSVSNVNSGDMLGKRGVYISQSQISGYNYRNKLAAEGDSATGAPGYLTQADIMTVLGNAATPRSDTFVIRAYGEAKDNSGNVIAKAYCEAVVQRQIEYVDSIDPANAKPANSAPVTNTNPVITSPDNSYFGRKFTIESFKWLNEKEV